MFKGIKDKLFFLFLMRILPIIIEQSTPMIRGALVDFISDFEAQAEKTDNPVDDILADLLKIIFGIED